MKAVVKYANEPEAVEARDIPEPNILPNTVLVEVRAVGVCGSDIHMLAQHPERKLKGGAARHAWPRVGRDHRRGRGRRDRMVGG